MFFYHWFLCVPVRINRSVKTTLPLVFLVAISCTLDSIIQAQHDGAHGPHVTSSVTTHIKRSPQATSSPSLPHLPHPPLPPPPLPSRLPASLPKILVTSVATSVALPPSVPEVALPVALESGPSQIFQSSGISCFGNCLSISSLQRCMYKRRREFSLRSWRWSWKFRNCCA